MSSPLSLKWSSEAFSVRHHKCALLCSYGLLLFLLRTTSTSVDGFVATTGSTAKLHHDASDQTYVSTDESDEVAAPSLPVDPLLMNALLAQTASFSNGLDVSSASNGIRTWRECLGKGRFPMVDVEFSNGYNVWPTEPLFSKVIGAMTTLQLPRFVLRHPETVSAVLLTLLRLTTKFTEELRLKEEEREEDEAEAASDDDYDSYGAEDEAEAASDYDYDYVNVIAEEVAGSLMQEWNAVVSGLGLLDQLFGYEHGLLNVSVEEEEKGIGGATQGFGLDDGIWKHTGWKEIPALQKAIASMQELKSLLEGIGRRPTADNSDQVHKFAPRKLQSDGAMGAQFDPRRRESVTGITLSNSLSDMLPSEAVLLKGSSPALRRLFLAKKAESKLLSYQMSGWADVPSAPLTRPLYLKRMPSAPGGPIVICLDTSWSMSGMREQLSKAVVLACVSKAHKQKRDCQVVAFSTERGVMEAGIITPDSHGIQRLLDFLSHSFGGGTDVTGALKYAMETLDSGIMSAADILMISDGEIPDPPVSNEVMEALDRLKLTKGVEVHGLLVGKTESKPLSRLCTETHDFLIRYDTSAIIDGMSPGTSTALRSTSLRLRPHEHRMHTFGFHRASGRRKSSVVLQAKYSKYDDGGERVRKKGRKNEWNDDEDNDFLPQNKWDEEDEDDNSIQTTADGFTNEVALFTQNLKAVVNEAIENEAWKPEMLNIEREAEGSCWKYREQMEIAVERVNEGLIERQEEARLVVLAMLAMEHILLLGVPGTGKSVLGRRLSKLCNGAFFQRLLTKFSTPEELFGPLSLKSLENDEYRRCTAGFLPTASIAFLDEIFKANSAILNTLLTILNERKFDNAGGQEVCPIRCVVGASNELPESDELVALFDRFLIRQEVLPVTDEGVLKMLSMSNPGSSPCDHAETEKSCDIVFTDGLDEVIGDLSIAADCVHIGDAACELIRDLRIFMREEHNVEISDRRLVKAARLLKISAASHGRNRVDPIDCLLLQHCMWQLPEHKVVVQDWLWENLIPRGSMEQFRLLLNVLRGEILVVIRRTVGDVTGASGGRTVDIDVIQSLHSETSRISSILQKHQADLIRHIEILRHSKEFLWLDPDETKAIQQLLLPNAEMVLKEVNTTLTDSRSLELCLEASPQAPTNELRLSVVELLWEEDYISEVSFTDNELSLGMREAKKKYDLETFRKWKRARKRADK